MMNTVTHKVVQTEKAVEACGESTDADGPVRATKRRR